MEGPPTLTNVSRPRPFFRSIDPFMKPFFVLRSRFFVCSRLAMIACSLVIQAIAAADEPEAEASYRPEAGKFPPLEKAHSYRGELVFVDHANRRGSIRVRGIGHVFPKRPAPVCDYCLTPSCAITARRRICGTSRSAPCCTSAPFSRRTRRLQLCRCCRSTTRQGREPQSRSRHRPRREPRPPARGRAQPLSARRAGLEAQGSGDQKTKA
jgi:hypothetical protein